MKKKELRFEIKRAKLKAAAIKLEILAMILELKKQKKAKAGS